MKKTIAILLAVIFAVNFASCGEKPAEEESSTPEPVTITVCAYEDGKTSFWESVIAGFEAENSDVEIVLESGNISATLRHDILNGKSPDVVFLPASEGSGITEALIKDKALCDITDLMETVYTEVSAGVYKNSFCMPYGDGKVYIAPFSCENVGIFYDAAVLEGVEEIKSFEDLVAYADKLGSETKLFAFAGKNEKSLRAMVAPVIKAVAGEKIFNGIFGLDGSAWDESTVTDAFNMIDSLTTGHNVLLDSADYTDADVIKAIAEGKVAFGLLSNPGKATAELFATADEELQEKMLKMDIKQFPVPLGDSVIRFADMGELYIPIEASHKSEAKRFIAYLYGKEAAVLCRERLGTVCPTRTELGEGVTLCSYRVPALAGVNDDFEKLLYGCVKNMLTDKMAVSKLVSEMKNASEKLGEYILR